LEEELRAFNIDKDLSSSCIISWNHQEFEVQYTSLAEEIKIGRTLRIAGMLIVLVLHYLGQGVLRSRVFIGPIVHWFVRSWCLL